MATIIKRTINKTWWKWIAYERDKKFREALVNSILKNQELGCSFKIAAAKTHDLFKKLKDIKTEEK